MRWVRHLASLHDFIGFIVLRAPDRFPKEDFLSDDDQLTLDRAFDELRTGLEFVETSDRDPHFHDRLNATLDESLAAYRAGERKKGAHLLQDFQDMIFGSSDQPS
jgi:hypothetical protein